MTHLGVGITSRGRWDSLRQCLGTLRTQTEPPHVVCIADCTPEPDRSKVEQAALEARSEGLNTQYTWDAELSRACGRNKSCRAVIDAGATHVLSTETDMMFESVVLAGGMAEFAGGKRSLFVGCMIGSALDGVRVGVPGRSGGAQRIGRFQLLTSEDFLLLGGYNELLKGWGFEDVDFWNRARARGFQAVVLQYPPYAVWHIAHMSEKNPRQDRHNRKVARKSFWDGSTWRMR